MVKDFTDYIPCIFDSQERVYHLLHFRSTPKLLATKTFQFKGHKYGFNPDRAYRVNWRPWSKLLKREDGEKWKKVKGFKVIKVRKASGQVVLRKEERTFMFSEPKKPLVRLKPFGTMNELIRTKRVGLLLYQEPIDPLHGIEKAIDPIHISRIHQPSGELMP